MLEKNPLKLSKDYMKKKSSILEKINAQCDLTILETFMGQ